MDFREPSLQLAPSALESVLGANTVDLHVKGLQFCSSKIQRGTVWILALLGGLSVAPVRLFTGNQHTYLAHAAAAAPNGPLRDDWFVNTIDPVPLFSSAVAALLACGHWTACAANVLVGALFFLALGGIVAHAARSGQKAKLESDQRLVAVCVAGVAALWITGPEPLRRALFEGIAEQRAYSPYLQPSNAGVLLVCAVWLALERRPLVAVSLAAAAVWIHPTYALSAVLFTGGVCLSEARSQAAGASWLRSAVLGLSAIVPPSLVSLRDFAPTSCAISRAASGVLVFERLPGHAQPASWATPGALLHVLPVLLVIALARGRVRILLASWALLSAAVSALVIAANRPELFLLFPWRTTVWLLPATFALLAGHGTRAVERLAPWSSGLSGPWGVAGAAGILFVVCSAHLAAASGAGVRTDVLGVGLAQRASANERERWTLLVPVDWEGVRLNAPAAVYVDFKSHPYKDHEVLAWRDRIRRARAAYAGRGNCSALSALLMTEPRIGFVLASPISDFGSCRELEAATRDADGILYRVKGRTTLEHSTLVAPRSRSTELAIGTGS